MYAAAGGASLAGRKARQHGRQPAPPSPHPNSPLHPAPTGVRAYSCQHWEARLQAPTSAQPLTGPPSPCHPAECAAGRAAWAEAAAISVGGGFGGAGGAARRCSVLGDHPGARKGKGSKWHRNNRVRDASYGSSSDSDGEAEAVTGEPWGVARLLYAGLGTLALGLVVYFVGTGDKGFRTPALRLVGPSLIVTGLACCILRICFCIFAKPCCRRRTNYKENRRLSGCGEGEEMPLAGNGSGSRTRAGPAQCSPARRLDASSCDVSSLSSGEEDERMRRYRTASLHPPTIHQVQPAQGTSHPALQQSASNQSALQRSGSHHSGSAGAVGGTSLGPAGGLSPGPVGGTSPGPVGGTSPGPVGGTSPGPVGGTSPGSAGLTPALASARRPPPRNVSFAGGPDGELVLSPAQLRS